MRNLSTRRRHPLAGFMVLLLGLLAAGGLFAAFAPQSATAYEEDSRKVEAGRQLFLVGCASCHGKNASGTLTKEGSQYGPSLIGVGAAAVDFQVGTGRMPLTNNSPQAPGKKPVYTDEEISQLAAFVASLGPGPSIPGADALDYLSASEEDVKRGGEFFRTNCTACHNSVGAGGALPNGRYAPSLTGASAKHIYEAMETGPQQMPVFSNAVITPEDKLAVISYIKAIQDEPSYGGYGGGGLGPVADGLITWIIGIGCLVGVTVWIAANGAKVKKQ